MDTQSTQDTPFICQACKPEPNKTIALNEKNECVVCLKPILQRNEKGQFIEGNKQDTNKNGTAGAPTKYKDEYVQKVQEYIESAKKEKKQLIGIEGFAEYLGTSDVTVRAWANKKLKVYDEATKKWVVTTKPARPEFLAAIKKLEQIQKNQLMTDGFYGGKEVNATMAIFLLKVNHGMIETQYFDHTTKGKEMPTPIMGGAASVPGDNSNP